MLYAECITITKFKKNVIVKLWSIFTWPTQYCSTCSATVKDYDGTYIFFCTMYARQYLFSFWERIFLFFTNSHNSISGWYCNFSFFHPLEPCLCSICAWCFLRLSVCDSRITSKINILIIWSVWCDGGWYVLPSRPVCQLKYLIIGQPSDPARWASFSSTDSEQSTSAKLAPCILWGEFATYDINKWE